MNSMMLTIGELIRRLKCWSKYSGQNHFQCQKSEMKNEDHLLYFGMGSTGETYVQCIFI